MAIGEHPEDQYANETFSAISQDSHTVEGEDEQRRETRRAKNRARAVRRQRIAERQAAMGRNLETAFIEVEGVPITLNNLEADIYGALLQLDALPTTPESRRMRTILEQAMLQARNLNTRSSMVTMSTRRGSRHATRDDREHRIVEAHPKADGGRRDRDPLPPPARNCN
jgi:hypothetical protein